MASTALFAWMASALFTPFAFTPARLIEPIFASGRHHFAWFALQLGDLDSGLGNEFWFLVIIAVLAIFMYFVYRGPKHM